MKRFVILDHQPPASGDLSKLRTANRHFDLMLEFDFETLRTFELGDLPMTANPPVESKKIADHDPKYLSYEGPISENRGTVTQVGCGLWEPQFDDAFKLVFDLHSPQYASETWILRFEIDGNYVSADFDPTDSFAAAGPSLSLKRLL